MNRIPPGYETEEKRKQNGKPMHEVFYIGPLLLEWGFFFPEFSRAFRGSGQTSRVGSADRTQPTKSLRYVDLTQPDPRDFESLSTRPNPTREI